LNFIKIDSHLDQKNIVFDKMTFQLSPDSFQMVSQIVSQIVSRVISRVVIQPDCCQDDPQDLKPNFRIRYEDPKSYYKFKRIANGSVGTVYRCTCKEDTPDTPDTPKKEVAIKKMLDSDDVFNELDIWSNIPEHQHVIKLIEVFLWKDHVYAVMELMAKSLTSMIPLPPHFVMMPLPIILRISHDLILAVKYLHANKVVHGDLKSDNILFDANGVLKLADFGVSTRDNECHRSAPWSGTLSWKSPGSTDTLTASPEKDDIWSVGIVLLELIGIPPPFLNMQDQYQLFRSIKNLSGYQVPKFDYYGDDFEFRMRGILKQCFQMDPTDRYSAEELLILFDSLFPAASR